MNPNEPQPEPKDTNQIIPLNAPSPAPLPEATPPTDSRRRIILTDAQGNLKEQPQEQTKYIVTPFPDGTVFRFMPHPAKPGTFLLVDSTGAIVAAVSNLGVAQILVQGAMMWLIGAMRHAADKNQKVDKEAKPNDTAANENKN